MPEAHNLGLHTEFIHLIAFSRVLLNRQTIDLSPIVTKTIRILQHSTPLLFRPSIQNEIDGTPGHQCIRNTSTTPHTQKIINTLSSRQHLTQPHSIGLKTPRRPRIRELEKPLFRRTFCFSAVGCVPEGGEGVLLGAGARHVDEAESDAAFVFGLGDGGGRRGEGCGKGFGCRMGHGDVDALGLLEGGEFVGPAAYAPVIDTSVSTVIH